MSMTPFAARRAGRRPMERRSSRRPKPLASSTARAERQPIRRITTTPRPSAPKRPIPTTTTAECVCLVCCGHRRSDRESPVVFFAPAQKTQIILRAAQDIHFACVSTVNPAEIGFMPIRSARKTGRIRLMWKRIIQSCAAVAALSGSSALAVDIVGTFTAQTDQGPLVIELRPDNGQLAGVVHFANREFPLVAGQDGNQIGGTWQIAGQSVPLTGIFDGTTLTL